MLKLSCWKDSISPFNAPVKTLSSSLASVLMAELFEVNNNCLVSVFFVLERKKPVLLVFKYSGTFDANELLKVYERLLKDENRVL